jgi:hypothetical protein
MRSLCASFAASLIAIYLLTLILPPLPPLPLQWSHNVISLASPVELQ